MLGLRCDPMPPISGFLMAVHDCNDEHEVWLNGVEHGVWKNARKATPDILLQDGIAVRALNDALNGGFNTGDKAKLQPRLHTR